MPESANADRVARLVLRLYREPIRYRAQMRSDGQLPGMVELVLRLALGRHIEFSEPALRTADVAAELERAAVFYVQQYLFREGATHYELWGLSQGAPQEAVREHFRLLMQLIHPDRQPAGSPWPESFAARANRAYGVLKHVETRADYDQAEAVRSAVEAPTAASPAGRLAAAHPPMARRPVKVSPMPEWLTSVVGGFVREHPGLMVAAALTSLSALVIGAVAWDELSGVLARDEAKPGAWAARRALLASAASIEPPQARNPDSVVAAAGPSDWIAAEPVAGTLPSVALPGANSERLGAKPRAARGDVPWVLDRAVATPASPIQAASAPGEMPPPAPAAVAMPAAEMPSGASVRSADNVQSTANVQRLPPVAAGAPPLNPPRNANVQPVAYTPPAERAATPAPVRATTGVDPRPPSSAEVEALVASFLSAYEDGRLDAFAGLFEDDARTGTRRGRPAIRGEYDEIFRRSAWRRMVLTQLHWYSLGDRIEARGELTVKIGWRDGREVEERRGIEMDLVQRGGRTVIARLVM